MIHDLGKDSRITLHITGGAGNAKITGFLLCSLEETEHTYILIKLLLVQNYVRHTAWHVVTEKGEIEVLYKLCEWGKEVLTQEELNNILFFARDGPLAHCVREGSNRGFTQTVGAE
jgi:hypothetical protein